MNTKRSALVSAVTHGNELNQTVELLRSRISSGHLAPGAPLREHALAAELGVSRSRARAALLALQQRGLVEQRPNCTAVVTRLDQKSVFDLFDIRENLEGLCVRLATERQPARHWEDLVELFNGKMVRYAREHDYEPYLAEVDRFRTRVAQDSENSFLFDLLASLYDRTRPIINRTILLPGRVEKGLKELQLVVAAMHAGDGEAAERLRKENIRSQREFLRRYQKLLF